MTKIEITELRNSKHKTGQWCCWTKARLEVAGMDWCGWLCRTHDWLCGGGSSRSFLMREEAGCVVVSNRRKQVSQLLVRRLSWCTAAGGSNLALVASGGWL